MNFIIMLSVSICIEFFITYLYLISTKNINKEYLKKLNIVIAVILVNIITQLFFNFISPIIFQNISFVIYIIIMEFIIIISEAVLLKYVFRDIKLNTLIIVSLLMNLASWQFTTILIAYSLSIF